MLGNSSFFHRTDLSGSFEVSAFNLHAPQRKFITVFMSEWGFDKLEENLGDEANRETEWQSEMAEYDEKGLRGLSEIDKRA